MNAAYQLLRALLLVLWPPVVWASVQITIDTTLSAINHSVWLMVAIVSSMGGLTSLLHRLKTEVPPQMFLYVCSHLMLAWFAGLASFFVFELVDFPDLLEIPMIGVSAYSGGRVVDKMSESLAVKLETLLTKVFG